VKKALIHRKTDPAVFKGDIAGKTAIILIHQALLSGHEAFCAGGMLSRWQHPRKRKLFFAEKICLLIFHRHR